MLWQRAKDVSQAVHEVVYWYVRRMDPFIVMTNRLLDNVWGRR